MARQRQRTFADIVRSEIDKPARSTPARLPPGRHDRILVTSDRRRWVLVTDDLDPEEAARLVRLGGSLAFDPCGCGGACGLDIIDADITAELPHAEPPRPSTNPRSPGSLSHWIAENEPTLTLVLASGRVTWGRALS